MQQKLEQSSKGDSYLAANYNQQWKPSRGAEVERQRICWLLSLEIQTLKLSFQQKVLHASAIQESVQSDHLNGNTATRT